MAELLASALVCTLALWLAGGVLCSLVYPLIRSSLFQLKPAQSSFLLLIYLALPAICALATTALLYTPDIAAALVSQHCHAGQCNRHGPVFDFALITAALLTLWYGWRLARCAKRQWWPGLRMARQLRLIGKQRGALTELDSQEYAAFTLGWWRPKIYLTSALLNECSETDIQCIVAHEQAHRRRRDNLRQLLAAALSAALPAKLLRRARQDLTLLQELSADEAAAASCSREAVAATLLRVVRLQQDVMPTGVTAFTGGETEQRIQALLQAPMPALRSDHYWVFVTCLCLLVSTAINPLHQLIEQLPI